ncbi:MAG: hypothetical protein PVG32_15110 [Anaerolineales bacterium]|jgi:hypothetical protein
MMVSPEDKKQKTMKIVRWVARVWSLVILFFFLLIFIGEILSPHTEEAMTLSDAALLILFPIATCLGLALAWRWEFLGGVISLISIVLFVVIMGIAGRLNTPSNFIILLAFIAIPGVLFLITWSGSRGNHELETVS